MRIVVGSGNNRHVFERPSRKDKVALDQMGEDLKVFLGLRPRVQPRKG